MPDLTALRLLPRWPLFYARAARSLAAGLAGASGPDGTVPLLFVTDLHAHVGMGRVIGAAVRALGAPVVLNGGDTTFHGTRPEGFFVRAFARALPSWCVMVACGGNHDSVRTDRQARRAGIEVPSAAIVTVAGIRVLAASDPRWMSLGRPVILQGGDDLGGQAARLTAVAKEAEAAGRGPDILLVHDPYVAVRVLPSGAVPLALCGHMHHRRGPVLEGRGVLYQGSSTGRDVAESTLMGPLRHDAELTAFYFDPATRRVTHYRLLTITPAARAQVGGLQAMPEPAV